MKQQTSRTGKGDPREGSVLLIVVCCVGIMAIGGISMTWMTGNSAHTSRNMQDVARSLSIAEAGVADMLTKMSTNYLYWQNRGWTTNYEGGTFSVTNKTFVNGHVLISSTGAYNGEQRTTTLELLGDQYAAWRGLLGSYGAILAGGDIFLRTAALTVNGGVRCNSDIFHANGTPSVFGDLAAVGSITYPAKPGFTATPNAPSISIPNYLPFDPWLNLATNGGIYYNSSVTLPGVTLTPGNGVVYVKGDCRISNRSGIIGTLVATGTITIDNRFDHTPFDPSWPAVLAGVDVFENNLNAYRGIVFAGNNITSINRRDFRGTLIALNNVTVENGTTVSPPDVPPDLNGPQKPNEDPKVIIGGWLK